MLNLLKLRMNRLFAVLCMALTLVYAVAATAQIANQIEHSAQQVASHDHMVFSDAGSFAFDDHHLADDQGDGQADGSVPAGHHHHSDVGPGLMLPTAEAMVQAAFFEARRAPPKARGIVGVAVPGPERPPKQTVLSA